MHELHSVGRRMQRPDALAKATGAAQYTADLVVHRRDVLHAKALYPPYGHAKILTSIHPKLRRCRALRS